MESEFNKWFSESEFNGSHIEAASAAWDEQQKTIDALEARLEAKQQAAAEDHKDAV